MIYDTAGNPIYDLIQKCDCGLTGGCKKCSPLSFRVSQIDGFIGMLSNEEAEEMRKKIANFKKRFNKDFEEKNKKLFPL